MSTYFSMIFALHHMVFRYVVCHKEYMDLLPMFVSGTALEDREPMRRTDRSGSHKKI